MHSLSVRDGNLPACTDTVDATKERATLVRETERARLGNPQGEGLVVDQTGHARCDGHEREGHSVRRGADIEYLHHHTDAGLGHRVLAPWRCSDARRAPAFLTEMRGSEVHRGVTDVRTAAPTVACHSLMPEEADLRGGDQREGARLQRAVHVNAVNTVARSAPVAAPLLLGFPLTPPGARSIGVKHGLCRQRERAGRRRLRSATGAPLAQNDKSPTTATRFRSSAPGQDL